jgi:POTRA domain, FtsQ-type
MLVWMFKTLRRTKRRKNFRRVHGRERRQRREHVLDAKLPPSSREEGRLRVARWKKGMQAGLGGGFFVVAALGGREVMARHFWNNADLLVHDPEIKSNGSLTHDEILRQAGIAEGTYVYSVDLREARARLESLPNVRHASVERILPGRLVISVEERLPVAWLSCDAPAVQAFTSNPDQGARLLDEDGVIFPCVELKAALMKLPVIHVKRLPNVQAGVRVEVESVQRGIELVALSRGGLRGTALEVGEIDAPNDWSLVVKFSDDSVATFGLDHLSAQWQRLLRVMEIAQEDGRRLATLNLLPQKNVPVTFFDSPPPSEVGATPGLRKVSADKLAIPHKAAAMARPGQAAEITAPPHARETVLDEILGGGN